MEDGGAAKVIEVLPFCDVYPSQVYKVKFLAFFTFSFLFDDPSQHELFAEILVVLYSFL